MRKKEKIEQGYLKGDLGHFSKILKNSMIDEQKGEYK